MKLPFIVRIYFKKSAYDIGERNDILKRHCRPIERPFRTSVEISGAVKTTPILEESQKRIRKAQVFALGNSFGELQALNQPAAYEH